MERVIRYQVCAWMLYLGDWVENVIDKVMVQHNITLTQARVLRLLAAREGIGPGEVSRLINRDESTTTGILKRLEAAGLIARTLNENDRRQAQIWLTDQGRAMIKVFQKTFLELPLMKAMADVPEEEIMQVLRFFSHVSSKAGLEDFTDLVRSYSDEMAKELSNA